MKLFKFSLLEMGADLYDLGYENITNIDMSSVVISQMNDRFSNREEMECKACLFSLFTFDVYFLFSVTQMDARNMEYLPNGCFDIIVDKGGNVFLACIVTMDHHNFSDCLCCYRLV